MEIDKISFTFTLEELELLRGYTHSSMSECIYEKDSQPIKDLQKISDNIEKCLKVNREIKN